jgi:hypothetical protein
LAADNPTALRPILARPNNETIKPPKPIAAVIAIGRSPRMVSVNESDESTPTSIRMNKKSIITAPVYTTTWTIPKKAASCAM